MKIGGVVCVSCGRTIGRPEDDDRHGPNGHKPIPYYDADAPGIRELLEQRPERR